MLSEFCWQGRAHFFKRRIWGSLGDDSPTASPICVPWRQCWAMCRRTRRVLTHGVGLSQRARELGCGIFFA